MSGLREYYAGIMVNRLNEARALTSDVTLYESRPPIETERTPGSSRHLRLVNDLVETDLDMVPNGDLELPIPRRGSYTHPSADALHAHGLSSDYKSKSITDAHAVMARLFE